jgi:hypothetical protein
VLAVLLFAVLLRLQHPGGQPAQHRLARGAAHARGAALGFYNTLHVASGFLPVARWVAC